MCTQCVFRLLQLIYLISARQKTIIMVAPDQLKVKNMILISIQCVLNVYTMCIQALAANKSHFSESKDYNNGGARKMEN